MRKLKNPYKSLYKARNNFLAAQFEYKTNKFGVIKTNGQKLKYGLSKSEDAWLDKLCVPYRSIPIYGLPLPNSKKRKVYIVDGYDPNTNTVYEYLGNFAHGAHNTYPKNRDIKTWLGKTPNELYYGTVERFKILYELGYKVFFVWESDDKAHKSYGRYYRGLKDNLY